MKLIAYSMDDIAGSNVAEVLRDGFGFIERGEEHDGVRICGRDDTLLVASRENITRIESFGSLHPEVCVVVSRHRSESGTPTLTSHVTGNFGSADVGGEPGRLSIAPALYLRKSLEYLRLNQVEGYEVSLEVTHHGPTRLPFPLLYVEVGSSEEQWNDMDACTAVAEVADALVSLPVEEVPSAIGFGGPHYAPNFNDVVKTVALGHIAPKYALEYVDIAMVEQMVERTVPRPELAVLDWKGMRGEEKKRVTGLLDELGLGWEKSSELKG
ncbi:MAG: D-aminoacyl-tRNA deacylase [Candidatus Altiarchaeota archaeon]